MAEDSHQSTAGTGAGFYDALEDLNRLEFVELHTQGTGPNDGRRLAVHHSRIIGLYDPDWELLPHSVPPGDHGHG